MDDIIRIPPPSRILMCKCGELKLYIDETEGYSGPMPRCPLCNTVTSISAMSPANMRNPQEVIMEQLEVERERLRKEAAAEEKRKRREAEEKKARQDKLRRMTEKLTEPPKKVKEKQQAQVESISEEEALWRSRLQDQPRDPKAK